MRPMTMVARSDALDSRCAGLRSTPNAEARGTEGEPAPCGIGAIGAPATDAGTGPACLGETGGAPAVRPGDPMARAAATTESAAHDTSGITRAGWSAPAGVEPALTGCCSAAWWFGNSDATRATPGDSPRWLASGGSSEIAGPRVTEAFGAGAALVRPRAAGSPAGRDSVRPPACGVRGDGSSVACAVLGLSVPSA